MTDDIEIVLRVPRSALVHRPPAPEFVTAQRARRHWIEAEAVALIRAVLAEVELRARPILRHKLRDGVDASRFGVQELLETVGRFRTRSAKTLAKSSQP